MAGDNIEEERRGTPDEFLSRRWYERAFIAVAGPAANFVMAAVCAFFLFFLGVEYPLFPNVVGPLEAGGAVESVGLRTGDEIVSVDGVATAHWEEAITALGKADEEDRDAQMTLRDQAGERSVRVPADSLASVLGQIQPNLPSVVGQVAVGMPAFRAGLQEGDRIVEVDGVPVGGWQDLVQTIGSRPGKTFEIAIERAGQEIRLPITPIDQDGQGRIGVVQAEFATAFKRYPAGEALTRGVQYPAEICARVVVGLKDVVTSWRTAASSIAGPIAIMQMSAQQVEAGRTELLNWLVFISIALMTMNLLPIPVLDGGHILVAVIEAVRRRPLKARVMVAMWRAGMVFLLVLMTYVIAQDGLRIVQRFRADQNAVPVESPRDSEASSDATSGEGGRQ